MNDQLTKRLKAIQEQIMEAQSIALEYEQLLKKQWRVMAKAQKLLGGNGDAEQLQLFK
jgi:hypothetical protein